MDDQQEREPQNNYRDFLDGDDPLGNTPESEQLAMGVFFVVVMMVILFAAARMACHAS